MSRILVVEDDANLRRTLEDNLTEEGYAVATASSLAQARALAKDEALELVVLDLMLPDGDGYGFCRELKAGGFRGRVLMLTARTLEDDLVKGFEAGADDYVAKPYRLRELLARVAALLRRGGESQSQTLALGKLSVDLAARSVMDEKQRPIELTRTEFDLLAFLLRNRDRALSRDAILDAVWGKEVVVDAHTVDNFVSSLKKKLRWSERAGFEIRTLRGVGYRLQVE